MRLLNFGHHLEAAGVGLAWAFRTSRGPIDASTPERTGGIGSTFPKAVLDEHFSRSLAFTDCCWATK